ncbi:unnamed protein product, partial [Amoebophrya sp. A120]
EYGRKKKARCCENIFLRIASSSKVSRSLEFPPKADLATFSTFLSCNLKANRNRLCRCFRTALRRCTAGMRRTCWSRRLWNRKTPAKRRERNTRMRGPARIPASRFPLSIANMYGSGATQDLQNKCWRWTHIRPPNLVHARCGIFSNM